MNILIYDFETSRLPLFSEPSSDSRQPHIVQAAAVLVDSSTRVPISSIDLIAYPDGWESDEEAQKIHGVTAKHARKVGVSEKLIVETIEEMNQSADLRVGHVQHFDARIMRIALKRFVDDEAADRFKETETACTASMAKKAMEIKGRRNPKLTEAYEWATGNKPLSDAHSAMADVVMTMDLYWSLVERDVGEKDEEAKSDSERLDDDGGVGFL